MRMGFRSYALTYTGKLGASFEATLEIDG